MKMSESLANLGKGLAEFNGEVQKIAHDGKNPQFRSKYVTLDALIDATKPILQKHGLSVIQIPLSGEDGQIGVKSLLLHDSGEFIESEPLYMKPMKMVKGGEYVEAPDAQAAGSTISYLRRYSYQAILNLSTGEDDDGERAVGRGSDSGRSDNLSRENTTEPQQERSSRRERTETADKAEESTNTNQEQSSEDDGSRRGRRSREVSEEPKQETTNTTTEETSRRGSRRGQENTPSAPQSEESTGDSENASRRGSRRRG